MPGFLSDPDPDVRFAAIQWVGEHRLTEFRPRLQAGLASSAETRDALRGDAGGARDGSTARRAVLRDEVAGEDYVVALLRDARTPAPVLAARAENAPARPSCPHDRSLESVAYECE